MQEKILNNKKHGMRSLILTSLFYLLGVAVFVLGAVVLETKPGHTSFAIVAMIIGGVWICVGWIPYLGLKILKPQEALVLTLFGKYVGTIKGDGFYMVNPFCVGVNPAAKTRLNQSGDVNGEKETFAGII